MPSHVTCQGSGVQSAGGRPGPLSAAGRSIFGASSSPTGASSGLLVSESSILTNEQGILEALRLEVQGLEARLADARPGLRAQGQQCGGLRSRVEGLSAALAALGQARQAASDRVGQLSKAHLSEIKQLTKNPPETLRRTLAACWLLLNSDRCLGKTAVTPFDDTKDWPRCQRMLADDAFVARITGFDAGQLDLVPFLPLHVAASYLGMAADSGDAGAGGDRAPTAPQKPSGGAAVDSGGAVSRTSVARRRSSSSSLPKAPLDLESVTRASEPCGALYRWMQELVLEYVERSRILEGLRAAQGELKLAEEREAILEGEVAEVEAALSRARGSLAERKEALERLRREQASATQAEGKLRKMEVLGLVPQELTSAAPKPRPAQKPKDDVPVEIEVSGTLACVEQKLAQMRVPFLFGQAKLLEGDVEQALIMPRIAEVLKDHRGKLKLLLEGHRDEGEGDSADIERSLAVFEWLVSVAGCPPGCLRLQGRGTSAGLGLCVVPVPIQELQARSGPVPAELAAVSARPGIYFAPESVDLQKEAVEIVAAMARSIAEDEYTVRVEGHTHRDEPDGLAMKRARAVCDALVERGVFRSQLKPKACKALFPMSRVHAAANRRVEVHVE